MSKNHARTYHNSGKHIVAWPSRGDDRLDHAQEQEHSDAVGDGHAGRGLG